jgi:hypothetical protein
MNRQEVERHTERGLHRLRVELAGTVPPDEVMRVGWAHFHDLLEHATIYEFIPLLVGRRTRETLRLRTPGDLHRAA